MSSRAPALFATMPAEAVDWDMVVDSVRLPDALEVGLYDQLGTPLREPGIAARLVIDLSPPAPIYHFWAVFAKPLAAGAVGSMTLFNLPGEMPAAGVFTEWDRQQNAPVLRDGVFTRIAVQRAAGVARVVARNESSDERICAAGVVIGSLRSIQ